MPIGGVVQYRGHCGCASAAGLARVIIGQHDQPSGLGSISTTNTAVNRKRTSHKVQDGEAIGSNPTTLTMRVVGKPAIRAF